MIDWEPYGPIYSVAPGIKKIKDLPIIEYDEHEERYKFVTSVKNGYILLKIITKFYKVIKVRVFRWVFFF